MSNNKTPDVFTNLDWLALYAFTAFVFFQFSNSSMGANANITNNVFDAIDAQRGGTNTGIRPPPGWLFGVIWTVLYALIVATTMLVWRSNKVLSRYTYDSLLALLYINIVLNKLWSSLFFGQALYLLAFIDAVLLIISALIVAGILANNDMWLPFWLYIPYCVWLIVAIILNSQFL
jgi:tryptophan-rich sensory protein